MKLRYTLISALICQTAIAVADDQPNQVWHQNYDDACREAKAANLPILLHFYADWCGPCQQMEQGVLNSPDVMRQLGTVVVGAKIDVDHHPQIVARYAVEGYPFDLVVSPDGKVLHRASGYAQPTHYIKRIRTAAAGYRSSTKLATTSRPAKSETTLGLRGFSPVAITCERKWRRGRRAFSWEYENVEYRFRNAEELKLFQADPHSYVPQFDGNDPVILADEGRREPAGLNYGRFYHNQLYLFSSAENRKRFAAAPQDFIKVERIDLVDLTQVDP